MGSVVICWLVIAEDVVTVGESVTVASTSMLEVESEEE